MKEVTIVMEFDKLITIKPRLSEKPKPGRYHYTFGKHGDAIAGGFYVLQGTTMPDRIILDIKKPTANQQHQGTSPKSQDV